MRGAVVIVAFVVVGAGAGACASLGGLSSSDGDAGAVEAGSDAPLDVGDAAPGDAGSFPASCAAYAQISCDRLAGCYPAAIQLRFGGPASCQARVREACLADVGAPDVLATPADVDRCSADIAAQTCEAAIVSSPPSCTSAGARANGAPCVASFQCQSRLCGGTDATGCGHCATPATEGAPCADGCADQLVCTSGTCVRPRDLAASCDTAHPCNAALSCFNGACAAPLAPGASCDASGIPCDILKGFACVGGICATVAFAQSDQACGVIGGTATYCAGGDCANLDGGVGTCVGFAQPGEACNPSATPPKSCIFLDRCVAGQCVYPSQTLCGL